MIAGHSEAWIKVLGVGKKWEHTSRVHEMCVNQSVSINPMYKLLKHHKPKVGGDYKTRPVVSSHLGMAYQLNNLLSNILEPIARKEDLKAAAPMLYSRKLTT